MIVPFFQRAAALLIAALLVATPMPGAVVINELQAGASDRLLQWDANGNPRVGNGVQWQNAAFNDASWQTGAGPFGFGSFGNSLPTAYGAIGTNLVSQMLYLTPTLYLRKTFSVGASDAQRTDPVQLTISYNDGFICWINGVEVARRWAGPAKEFIYHDQGSYTPQLDGAATPTNPGNYVTETISLGAANSLLTAGTNIIAVQGLNISATSTNFLVSTDLSIGGATPTALVGRADAGYKYLPGVVEPSAGVYDPALLNTGKLYVPWGAVTFDDSNWATGPGPLGAGTSGLGTTVSGVIGVTPSLYARTSFTATAAQVADTRSMTLTMTFDDSFIAYINGVEVARVNVGTSNTFTPHTAVANGAFTPAPLPITIDSPNHLLVAGTNELAIQVHNVTINDSDILLKADLKTGSGAPLVANTQNFRYMPGTSEPIPESVDDTEESSPDAPSSVVDWVELYNNGTTDVPLVGWSLTDDFKKTTKWIFPDVTIPAGGYLVVICDGLNTTSATSGYVHTNFQLSSSGEYLGLYNQSGLLMDALSPTFPAIDSSHSYGRDASGKFVFFDSPTPGAANAGTTETGIVSNPVFSLPSNFYTSAQTITLSTPTPGATIRYTIDGTEPTATNGSAYGGGISASSTVTLRARAFLPGLIPSSVATGTYVFGASALLKSIPALFISGDQQQSLYRPFGVMSIVDDTPSNFASDGNWLANGNSGGYNNPSIRSQAMERRANLELAFPTGVSTGAGYVGFNKDFGLRMSGSYTTRPRYTLFNQNSATSPNGSLWPWNNVLEKPSFDFYFRGELGGSTLTQPLFPDSPVTTFHDLRLRAGNNDIDPFIQDEMIRRLFIDMGQVDSAGILTTVWINGVYKGWFNLCEHLKDDFFQQSFNSTNEFDVLQGDIARGLPDVSSGDYLAFQEMTTYARSSFPYDGASQASLAAYQGMQTRLDVTNFADYLVLNTFCETQDWPDNNYVSSRERAATGRFRFHCWDAEGSFGDFHGSIFSNSFRGSSDTSVSELMLTPANAGDTKINDAVKILYSYLRSSSEFRLLFADRVQKQLINSNGALYKSKFLARYNTLRNQIAPFIAQFATVNDPITYWVNGIGNTSRYTLSGNTTVNLPSRLNILLTGYNDDTQSGVFVPAHYVSEGLWPATLAPNFSQLGGNLNGSPLTISNPNNAGTIYYTTDGSDPRAPGGAVSTTAVSGGAATSVPVTVSQATEVQARILNTNGEWSPLQDQVFAVATTPAVIISEIMYAPPDSGAIPGDDFQFIELKNTTSSAVALNGWQLSDGVTFTFPPSASIAANSFVLVVSNSTEFFAKYPNVPAAMVAGVYSGSLAHSGELITLRDLAGEIVMGVTYGSASPWPTLPSGYGNSLVPVNPNSLPSPSDPTEWRASTAAGGSPGADDPTPTALPVQINELLANPNAQQKQAVELYNPSTSQAVDISFWYLSDDSTEPKKFQFPAGSVIPAGGYLVATGDDFNAPNPINSNVSFSYSANGDSVYLASADESGNLLPYSDGFAFGASSLGVSFGRYVNSVNAISYPAQVATSFGAPNAGPLVGPVVMTEMMIQPPVDPSPATATHGAIYHEYIEIQNISGATVPLYDPANPGNGGWKVDGYGYTFASGVSLAPGQFALIVPMTEAAWRTKYPDTPAAVAIFGPCTGNIKDSGETIALEKPGGRNIYIDVDRINSPGSAWPNGVLGTGCTLERTNNYGYADDPGNWHVSASSSGGTPGDPQRIGFSTWLAQHFTSAQLGNPSIGGPNADPDGDGIPNLIEWALGLDPMTPNLGAPYTTSLAMDGNSGPYLTLQFRRSLGIPANSVLVDTSADLDAWTLGGGVQIGTGIDNGDGTETVTVRDTVPVAGPNPPQRYLRLRVNGN